MSPAEEIYLAALDLPVEERADYVQRAAGGDAALRDRVTGMLSRESAASAFFEEAATAAPAAGLRDALRQELSPLGEGEGDRIGPYRLLQQIGTGGMGEVYMAEQEVPVRRRVALKVIKLGMDTRQVVARFEAERQALAMMDHPNIARVLDAGATQSGRPYFVMELVQGIPITEFCDRNRVDLRERIRLFLPVCRAIQSAHQKGVIHRDIKPSNVMVTLHHGEPMAKVIDFGVAKAVSQRLTDKTLFTQFGNMIGTPAYMSPEQAEMSSLDVDTRTDVYSLGVLLYELLTGTTPFPAERLRSLGLGQIQKVIAEEEPPIPSTRASTLQGGARKILTDGSRLPMRHLPEEIRGDLDWIVMKCLEKDRRRRYETPNELAADLERHLADEPVTARPPTAAYRLHKAYRRHRAVSLGVAAVLAALVLGIFLTSVQAVRARRAEAMAIQRQEEAESISRFLTEVFRSPDPERSGYSFTVAEALRSAASQLDQDLSRMPERRVALQTVLAETYDAIGLPREAADLRMRIVEHWRTVAGAEAPETLAAMSSLVYSLLEANRVKEALALQEQSVEIVRRTLGLEAPKTLDQRATLAMVLSFAERLDESIRELEAVLESRRRVQGPEAPETLGTLQQLAVIYGQSGRRDDGLRIHRQLLDLRRKLQGPRDPATLTMMANTAATLSNAGRLAEAIPMQDELVQLRREVLGLEHPDTLMAMHYRAYFEQLRDPAAAVPRHREVLTLRRKALGPEHRDTILTQHYLAKALEASGRPAEAISVREEVVRLREAASGPDHPHTLDATLNLMDDYMDSGRLAEALDLLHRCSSRVDAGSTMLLDIATREAWFAPEGEFGALVRRILDQAPRLGDPAEMERASRALSLRPNSDPAVAATALELARRVVKAGTNTVQGRNSRFTLGLAELRSGHPEEAEPLLGAVVSEGSLSSTAVNAAAHYQAVALAALGRREQARRVFDAATAKIPPGPEDLRHPLKGNLPTHQLLPWLAYREARQAVADRTQVP